MAYNVSSDFREQCYSGESLYNCRLIIGSSTIPTEQISSITISSPIIDDQSETFYIGTFISQKLTIRFKNLDGIDTTSGTNVELYISQYVNNAWVEVPIGKYIIDEAPENYHQTAEIECLDYAIKFATNLDYSPCFVDGKTTIDTLLAWICTHYGVTLGSYPNTNGSVEIGTYDSTISGKRWISYIAEIKACNAKMDRLGQLTLVPIKSSPAATINALESKSWELGEKFEVSKVVFFDAIRNYTFGDDTENTLYLRQDNPFILNEQIARNVYEKLRLDSETVTQAKTFNINNTIDGEPIQNLTLYGDTSQSSTPTPSSPVPVEVVTGKQDIEIRGKNLYNSTIDETTDRGITHSGDTGNIYINGTATNNHAINWSNNKIRAGTYKIMLQLVSGTLTSTSSGGLFYVYGDNVSISPSNIVLSPSNPKASATITVSADTTNLHINSWIRSTETYTNAVIAYQIVKGNEDDYNFEPFTSNTYEINLGKNLFDKDNANILNASFSDDGRKLTTSANAKTLYINCQPNTTYTVSKTGARFRLLTTVNTPAINVVGVDYAFNDGGSTLSITTSATVHYLCVYYFLNGTDTLTEQQILDSIQIEKGSKATTYSAYKTPIELCKIGTYQDKIYKDNGKWYLHKEIGKKVITGSESTLSRGGTNSQGYRWRVTLDNPLPATSTSTTTPLFCNRLTAVTPGNTYNGVQGITIDTANNYSFFYITDIKNNSLDNTKTWLNSNNIILYYILNEATNTEITDSELLEQSETIEQDATFKAGSTNVISTAPITFTKLTSNPFICYSLTTENYGDISLDAWDTIHYTLGNEDYYTLNNNSVEYAMTIMSKVETKIPTKQQEVTTNVIGGNNDTKIRRLTTEVNSLENKVTIQAAEIDENTGKVAELELTTSSISTTVGNNYKVTMDKFNDYVPTSEYVTLENSVTQLQTDTYTKTEINTKLTDGSVTKVQTTSGTFDENGMHYEKTGAYTKSTINEKGVEVDDSAANNELFFAGFDENINQTIVRTDNVKVRNYLVVGDNSRIQDYENGGGIFVL